MSNQPKLRIAVADDEEEILEYYSRMLAYLGYEVTISASNGRILVERCRETPPDLVITDVNMPMLDGLEAAGLLHEDPHVPVTLVSARDDAALVKNAATKHVVKFLVKPISKSDLQQAITCGLSSWQMQSPH